MSISNQNRGKNMRSDAIQPAHYANVGKDDVISFCAKNKLGFLEGNVVKYVARHKHKNGLEDLQKAQEYLRRLIEHEYPIDP